MTVRPWSQNARHTVWSGGLVRTPEVGDPTLAGRIMARYESNTVLRRWYLWLQKQAPGATIADSRVSTLETQLAQANATIDAGSALLHAAEGRERQLRDELCHLRLDVDFWKGETALKTEGLDELRGVLDSFDVPTGPIRSRLERVCKDRDDARKRVLAAENELRTLRAQLAQKKQGATGTTDPQTAAAKATQ